MGEMTIERAFGEVGADDLITRDAEPWRPLLGAFLLSSWSTGDICHD